MILNEVFLPIRLKRPFERCRQAASIGTLPFFWHLVSYHRQRLAGTAHGFEVMPRRGSALSNPESPIPLN